MEQKQGQILKKQVYVYTPKDILSIDMKHSEWITSEKVGFELEEKLRVEKYCCVFLKEQNVFAHYMNRFRSLLKSINTIALVGVDEVMEFLDTAQQCSLDIANNKIWIDGVIFYFNTMDLYSNVSEIVEYNLGKEEICYKPDYYYNAKLANIIVQGYNRVSNIIKKPHSALFRDDSRIWNSGVVFPSDFLELFSNNLNKYYELMEQYCKILFLLLASCDNMLDEDELTNRLIPHYTYSIFFSLIAPNIVKRMEEHDIVTAIAAVSDNTPFQSEICSENMREILHDSLKNLNSFLFDLQKGIDSITSYQKIYKLENFSNGPWVAMLFVTNLLQDIRRGVVNEVRLKYLWFEEICGHRKEKEQNNSFERI